MYMFFLLGQTVFSAKNTESTNVIVLLVTLINISPLKDLIVCTWTRAYILYVCCQQHLRK